MDTAPSERNHTLNTEGNEEKPLFDNRKDSQNKYFEIDDEKGLKNLFLPSPHMQILHDENQQEQATIGNTVYPTLINKKSVFVPQKKLNSQSNILAKSQDVQIPTTNKSAQKYFESNKSSSKIFQFKHAESIIQQSQASKQLSQSQSKEDDDESSEGQSNDKEGIEMILPDIVQTLEKAMIGKFLIQKKQIKSSITFGICIKVVKAVRMFKSYILPKKIYQRQADFINDASYFSNSSQITQFNLKKLPNSLRQRKLFDFLLQRNILFSKLKQYQMRLCHLGNRFLLFLDTIFPTIDPMNFWKLLFDSTMILIAILSIFINTVEVSFDISFDNIYPKVKNYIRPILIGFFFFSSFLDLNTKVSQKGVIEHSRVSIFKHYMKNRFLQEVLVIISLFTFDAFNKVVQYVIKLFILIQILVVSKTLYNFQQMTQSYHKNRKLHYIIKLIKLLLVVTLVAHLVAIIFYGQILIQENYGDEDMPNWVSRSNLIKSTDPWYSKYIFALYFSVTTMMTVGYGDITPINIYEAIISIVSMVIACGIFAYSFNLIGLIISEMNKRQKCFKKKMNNVNLYLSERNIDSDLRYKVQKYLQYKYENDTTLSKEEEKQVLSDLSSSLVQSIIFQTKLKILNKETKLFSQFSQEFKDNLCVKLKEIHISKDEVIFEQDTVQDDPVIYFIHKGQIEIYFKPKRNDEGEGLILNILGDGMQFGEKSFFLNTPRSACARAKESSIVYSLSQSDFLKSLSYFTQEKEKYHMVMHKMINSKSNQISSIQCYYCQSEQHLITSCPRLHYNPDQQLVLLKYNYSEPITERKPYQRSGFKYNSFNNLNIKYSQRKVQRRSIKRVVSPQKVDDSVLGNLESSYYNKLQKIQTKLSKFGKQKVKEVTKKQKKQENDESHSQSGFNSGDSDSVSSSSSNKSSSVSSSHSSSSPSSSSYQSLDQSIMGINLEQQKDSIQNKVNQFKETFISIPEENEDLQESQSLEKKNNHNNNHNMSNNQNNLNSAQMNNLQIANNVRFQNVKQSKAEKETQNLILQYTQQIKQDIRNIQNSFEESPSNKKANFLNRRGFFTIDQQFKHFDKLNTPKNNKIAQIKNEELQAQQNMKSKKNTFILRPNNKVHQKTLINLIQFKDQLSQLHQKLQLQQIIGDNGQLQPPRKSLNKSNTAIPVNKKQINEKTFNELEEIEEKEKEMKKEEIEEPFDVMKEYKYFYENFNYKTVIQNYNKLKSIQGYKLPPYFAVYSFQNRKNKKLRAQALSFEFNAKVCQ